MAIFVGCCRLVPQLRKIHSVLLTVSSPCSWFPASNSQSIGRGTNTAVACKFGITSGECKRTARPITTTTRASHEPLRKGRIIHEHLNGQDPADDVGVRYGVAHVSPLVQRYRGRTIVDTVVDREATPEAPLDAHVIAMTEDPRDILLWSDGTWCSREECDRELLLRNDNYVVIERNSSLRLMPLSASPHRRARSRVVVCYHDDRRSTRHPVLA